MASAILTAGAAEILTDQDVISITTADGRGADASVYGGERSTTNFGTAPTIAIKSIPYSIKKAYFRFDLSNLPDRAEITQAQLVFTTHKNHAAEQTIEVFGLADGHKGEDWVEGEGGEVGDASDGITYENAPGNAPTVGGGPSSDPDFAGGVATRETKFLGAFDVVRIGGISGEVFTFSSPELVNFLNSNTSGVVTIILTAAVTKTSEDVGFASKENPDQAPPQLRITLK